MSEQPATATEPWSGCFDCSHPAHPFRGDRDVRCGAPTNNGNPADGPEPCECVQWGDVLAAYRAIEAEAAAQAREALEEHIPQPGFLDGTGYVWCGCGWDTIDHDYDMSWPEHVAASAPQRPDAP